MPDYNIWKAQVQLKTVHFKGIGTNTTFSIFVRTSGRCALGDHGLFDDAMSVLFFLLVYLISHVHCISGFVWAARVYFFLFHNKLLGTSYRPIALYVCVLLATFYAEDWLSQHYTLHYYCCKLLALKKPYDLRINSRAGTFVQLRKPGHDMSPENNYLFAVSAQQHMIAAWVKCTMHMCSTLSRLPRLQFLMLAVCKDGASWLRLCILQKLEPGEGLGTRLLHPHDQCRKGITFLLCVCVFCLLFL